MVSSASGIKLANVLKEGNVKTSKMPCPDQSKMKGSGEIVKNGKKYIRVIGPDSVRDILIPEQVPKINRILFCQDELEVTSQKHKEKTMTSRAVKAESVGKDRAQKAAESILRKKELEKYPVVKVYGPVLTKLELESTKKASHLLQRVRELRKEETDEVKLCNTYILSKKCQAIRDAQIAEKKVIQKEMMEEDERLARLMEEERNLAEYEDRMKRQRKAEEREKYREALLQQIKDNELEREIMAEKRDEEQRCVSQKAIQVQLDVLRETKEKLEQKEKTRNDLNRINQEMMRIAEEEKKESELAELRIQEGIRLKVEEEAKKEEENRWKKLKRERSLAKVRDDHLQLLDKHAQRDQKEAKRIQEEVERKWRMKEKQAKEARMKLNAELKLQREKQMQDRRRIEAAEEEQEEKELEQARELEKMAKMKEEEEARRKKEVLTSYREELLKQINEKERKRIKEKQQSYEDRFLKNREDHFWNLDLKETLKRKVEEIRNHNIPENYVKDLERKLQLN